jgi:penicillin G amidase
LIRTLRLAALGIAGVVILALAGAYGTLRASLPRLDGVVPVPGIAAQVAIERDALGVPTVSAASRPDLAFGLGFAHGADRFFQMDLARRLAAGELSELVGSAALSQDLQTRLFRFRALARLDLERASPEERALLTAYAHGVNAGVARLRSRPWQYWLLRTRPAPWRPEDSFLVEYAMWWDLQYGDLRRDRARRTVDAKLRGPQCGAWKCALQFLYPERTRWDAPNVLDEQQLQAEAARDALPQSVPGPQALDVRGAGVHRDTTGARDEAAWSHESSDLALGSNSWAVAGRLTASGAALVASDMHLGLQVPPTWYRARLRVTGAHGGLDLNGLTLPGAPVLVAGSNGEVAWAFTNSDGDWFEAHPIECLSVDGSMLRTPSGDRALTTVMERIRVRGAADVLLPVRSAAEGILFATEPQAHRCWFAAWLAELPETTNMSLLAVERAHSAQEVLALAPEIGIPHQNLIVGDRAGHIAWTIAGRVPRASDDLRMRAAAGWRSGEEAPRLYDPPLGRLWSANARATADPTALAALGGEAAPVGAQYTLGARARQIRDALLALPKPATPRDMLRIQLDDRAVFLAHWRALLLGLLDAPAIEGHASRAEFRRLIAAWDGQAGVDSVGYRLVRVYYDDVASAAWQMILRALAIDTDAPAPPQFEQPLWTLVSEQPLHMLSAEYPSWRAFLLGELDTAIGQLDRECGALARCRWGEAHPVHIRNPLSRALPWLSWLIDYPPLTLPGDHDMPRVQDRAFGASERFAVSPGQETRGYLELPGGQSDHPLSPYFRAGLTAWAEGQPLPFLPGRSEHRLLLRPSAAALD